jgi:hypothetical protein
MIGSIRPTLATVTVAVLGGCASLPAQLPSRGASLAAALPQTSQLVLVVSSSPPSFSATGVPDKQLAAAAAGGSFFVNCASPAGSAVGGGVGGAAIALAWLAGCAVATPVAAAVGAGRAPTTEQVARGISFAESKAMQQSGAELQRAILTAAESTAPGRLAIARTGDDYGELRVALQRVELRGDMHASHTNPPIHLIVTVSAEIVAVGAAALPTMTLSYVAGPYTLAEWTANDGARLQNAIAGALEPLAQAVVDATFQLCPLPYRGNVPWSTEFAGLQAESPWPYGSPLHAGSPIIASLRPTLRWEGFPRDLDRAASPATMQRVEEVRYDVVLMRREYDARITLVARGEGIAATEFTPPGDLAPAQPYVWSVRARYTSGERTCVTEWSARQEPSVAAPGARGFPFVTPVASR